MPNIQEFANRLQKNAKHLRKWAKREGISCYRVYDRDLPQYPLAVDVYADRIHLQEFDTGWQITPEEHADWVAEIEACIAQVLNVRPDWITFKHRRRQKGLEQYQKTGVEGQDFIVQEGGNAFIVNLEEYLDTGLFLDHRPTRAYVQSMVNGKRFLNLFAYTGSFTVYAAAGGAASSVTVDLSNTYQNWSKRNFELNGLDLSKHQLIRADAFAYLKQAVFAQEWFDLIVLDPPSFSNSAKMLDILDVQQDHAFLIAQCMRLLSPQGLLIFSNNLRSFKLDEEVSQHYKVKEVSATSVPPDFRNKKIHRCWYIQH